MNGIMEQSKAKLNDSKCSRHVKLKPRVHAEPDAMPLDDRLRGL